MDENKQENMVSVATLADPFGQYRWSLERDSAGRFAGLWRLIGASDLQERDKEALTNVIWSLASLERAFQVLEADAKRAERVENEGAPAVMTFLSGPYGANSLGYLLATGLWMDLGEVLIAYRTLQFRLKDDLRQGVSAGRVALTAEEFAVEVAALEARRLPELGDLPIRRLANTSCTATGIPPRLWWISPGPGPGRRGSARSTSPRRGTSGSPCFSVVGETVDQVIALVHRLTARPPSEA